ncbi:unnamed protein product [Cylicostephanus goldi]|uniref:Metalloendopeptidase n=1 Tax=Cylicostephanus goldi TaxID=71465 RepID=A0A3P6SB32_CYLGO|nr:unnamed protein product [Cylicostephanus goldi]
MICRKYTQVGIALHEIGHALGFHHTHARHDRDQYIMVDIDAVQPGFIEEFNIEPTSRNDNYGIPYDYGSVMHYNCRSFAKDKSDKGNRTMVPHEPEYVDTLGSHFLSFYEKLMMNIHYNCFDRCKIDSNRLGRYSRTKPYDTSGSSSWVSSVYDGIVGGFAKIRHGFPSLPELKLDWGDWGGGCFGWSTCFGLGSHDLDSKTSTISTITTTTTSATTMKRPSSASDLSYPTARCEMGGFPNPKDCTKCVCPDGYGGRLCKRRPKGCGKVLQAKTNYRLLEDRVGYEGVTSSKEKEDFEKCIYWIKVSNCLNCTKGIIVLQAPKGRRIEVVLVRYDYRVATNGCYHAGIEIKTQKDQRATGYRQEQ